MGARSRLFSSTTLGLALVALGLSACWPVDRLEGKACDLGHPCVEPYTCIDGTCLIPAEDKDGGFVDAEPMDAGASDAGAPDASL